MLKTKIENEYLNKRKSNWIINKMHRTSALISCIIPTYKRQKQLLKSLGSVLDQTFAPFEIIIVNNGEERICFDHQVPPNVKIINAIRKAGASQARNIGAIFATGEFLAFLDDDDFWNINYLKNIVAEMEDGDKCFINQIKVVKNNDIVKKHRLQDCLKLENLLFHNPGVNGSSIVISRDLFFKIGGYDTELIVGEDNALMIEIILLGHKIKALGNNDVYYSKHSGGSLTSNYHNRYIGINRFIEKYKYLMSKQVYRYNLQKKYKYLFNSGIRSAKYKFYYHKIIYSLVALVTKKSIGSVRLKRYNLLKMAKKKIKLLLNTN